MSVSPWTFFFFNVEHCTNEKVIKRCGFELGAVADSKALFCEELRFSSSTSHSFGCFIFKFLSGKYIF